MIDHRKNKPAYSDPLGVYNTLPLMPPFFFQGMTARIFPLRASPFQIDVFCQTYLNFIPEELGRFRAFLPYVFLMVLDYGKLAAPVANIGWLSQYEIMFAVPVEWYKVRDGRWEFQNWTWLTPFIYVDSELSLLLGRQTYGWPKSLMRLTPAMSEWMQDPMSEIRRARVGAMVLPEMFVGATQKPEIILDIHQEASLLSSQIPPNFGGPLMPWMALGNAVQTVTGVMGDMLSVMNGVGITRAQDGADPQNFMKMAEVAAAMMDPYNPDLYFNTINLKQFRDSREPDNYCYQALTNAPMRLKQFNQGGLLGDVHQMMGDASGGFTIDLYKWPGYPIIELLGLEVASSYRGDGVDVAQIKPVFPFWYNVDMIYDRGINIAWRSFDTVWHGPSGERYAPKLPAGSRLERRYNSTLGVSASQTAAGVFEFTDTTARILPLLAKKDALQEFLDAYINRPLNDKRQTDTPVGARFEVWGPSDATDPHAYVYMVATTYGPMAAAEANVGAWQSESLQILVPVRWMKKVGEEWVLEGLGFVPAYTFSDSTEAVISGSEVLGIPTTKGVFVSPPNTWMSKQVALSGSQPLLKVSAEVLPAVDLGQEATVRQVLSIVQGPILPTADEDSWARMADSPLEQLYREQKRKRSFLVNERDGGGHDLLRDARAMTIDVLANRRSFHLFTMKQFRGVEDPEVACYQSIVRIPNVIDHVYDLREIEDNLHVEIREYPTLPIMRLLGLVGHLTTQQQGGGVVYKLVPTRPFWIRAKWKQDRGQRMWYRCGDQRWIDSMTPAERRDDEPADESSSFGEGEPRRTLALRKLDWLLSRGNPSDLDTLVRDSIDEGFQDVRPLTAEDEVRAMMRVDPQMVIESILSREWNSRDAEARWSAEYRWLAKRMEEKIESAPRSREKEVVVKFYRDLRYAARKRYHLSKQDVADIRLERIFRRFATFEEGFQVIEETYDALQLLVSRPKKERDMAQVRARLTDLFLAIHRSQLTPEDMAHESPAESKRRKIIQHRLAELLQELTGLSKEHVAILFDAGTELLPGSIPAPDEAFIDKCLYSFKHHTDRWTEIIRLLRRDREAMRQAYLKIFSKTAKKPDFCVLRDVAGPLAHRVFPAAASWDARWFEGERDDHRGEDVFSRPPYYTGSKDQSAAHGTAGAAEMGEYDDSESFVDHFKPSTEDKAR